MVPTPPTEIDDCRVLHYAILDESCRATGNCQHGVATSEGRKGIGPAAGMAICRFSESREVYLFSCDEEWRVLADTYHTTLEDAVAQAEFEYQGVSEKWVPPLPADRG